MCSGTLLEMRVQFLDNDRLGLYKRWEVSFYPVQHAVTCAGAVFGSMYLNIVDTQFSDEADFCSRYSRRFGILHGLQSSF